MDTILLNRNTFTTQKIPTLSHVEIKIETRGLNTRFIGQIECAAEKPKTTRSVGNIELH